MQKGPIKYTREELLLLRDSPLSQGQPTIDLLQVKSNGIQFNWDNIRRNNNGTEERETAMKRPRNVK